MHVLTARGQKIAIELCLKKNDPGIVLSKVDRLYLPDTRIHTAGAPGEAAACGVAASKLAILDLAGNLMPDWPAVARFGEEFPALVSFDLTGVRAAWPVAPPPLPSPFPCLSVLILNRSGISWTQAAALATALPALEELSISGNGIVGLSSGGGEGEGSVTATVGFDRLKALSLEDNAIEDWEEVERLAFLPSLERLHLSGNRLTRVEYPVHLMGSGGGGGEGRVPFATLNALLLGNNRLDQWESVDALNDFPAGPYHTSQSPTFHALTRAP